MKIISFILSKKNYLLVLEITFNVNTKVEFNYQNVGSEYQYTLMNFAHLSRNKAKFCKNIYDKIKNVVSFAHLHVIKLDYIK